MKILLASIFVLFALNTLAVEVGPDLKNHRSLLNDLDLDPNLGLDSDGLIASIEIKTDRILLKIRKPIQRGLIDVVVTELPVLEVYESCGSKVVTAAYDDLAVSGKLEFVEIRDHRNRVCKDHKKNKTEVTYKTETTKAVRGFIETESYLAGPALEAK